MSKAPPLTSSPPQSSSPPASRVGALSSPPSHLVSGAAPPSHLVWDGDTEALEAVFRSPKGPQEPVEVVDEQRHVDAVEANVPEGGVVDEWAAAVADGVADDPKQLGCLFEEGRNKVKGEFSLVVRPQEVVQCAQMLDGRLAGGPPTW